MILFWGIISFKSMLLYIKSVAENLVKASKPLFLLQRKDLFSFQVITRQTWLWSVIFMDVVKKYFWRFKSC